MRGLLVVYYCGDYVRMEFDSVASGRAFCDQMPDARDIFVDDGGAKLVFFGEDVEMICACTIRAIEDREDEIANDFERVEEIDTNDLTEESE